MTEDHSSSSRSGASSRRGFLRRAGVGATAAVAAPAVLAACSRLGGDDEVAGTAGDADSASGNTSSDEVISSDLIECPEPATTVAAADELPLVEWEMPTSWPTSLPTLWGGAQRFADRVAALTGGRFRITPRSAGEVAGPFDVLPLVAEGQFAVGSSASYYYTDLSPALAFGTAVPFGLTHRQGLSWLHSGGGLELLQEIHANRFNAIQFPVGATGAQMGGWFRKELNSLADLQGLRMRIPGLGGQVMARLGVEPVTIAAGEIVTNLQDDTIDAAEFVGPFDDSALGLEQGAQFYYYPGFWEPGPITDVQINLDEWNRLPPQYQEAIRSAAFETTARMVADYDALNGLALNELVASGVELRLFPDDILDAGRAASGIILDEIAAGDEDFARVLANWREFRRQVSPWFSLAEAALLQ
ncbi:MAG: ABC transporter substrate-binding protein [Actinomycetota bacterium]